MSTTGTATPLHLLDRGNHFDDIGLNGRYNRQRRYNYLSRITGSPLPRKQLHSHVADTSLTSKTIATTIATSLIHILLQLVATTTIPCLLIIVLPLYCILMSSLIDVSCRPLEDGLCPYKTLKGVVCFHRLDSTLH
jgi:hypothetical protein